MYVSTRGICPREEMRNLQSPTLKRHKIVLGGRHEVDTHRMANWLPDVSLVSSTLNPYTKDFKKMTVACGVHVIVFSVLSLMARRNYEVQQCKVYVFETEQVPPFCKDTKTLLYLNPVPTTEYIRVSYVTRWQYFLGYVLPKVPHSERTYARISRKILQRNGSGLYLSSYVQNQGGAQSASPA